MADIEFTCKACGNTTTASEFIDRDAVVCQQCGGKIADNAPPPAVNQRLKLKKSDPLEVAPQVIHEQESDHNEWLPPSSQHASAEHKERAGLKHSLGSWAVFLLIGGFMGVIRYTDWIQYPIIHDIKLFTEAYGPYTVLAFHLLITMKAFKDSVFQGVLCLLIPGYSFYYLFFMADDFYLRGAVGGIIVGVGQDSAKYFSEIAMGVADKVTVWIASGG